MVASPEITERILHTLQQGTQANRATPTREGNVVVLSAQAGQQVMVTADLHGNRVNFNKLCRRAELHDHPGRHLVMQEVCHGGPLYPSGEGCMSHLLLEDMARLKAEYPERFHFLLGNHELAEWTDFPISKSGRLLNVLFRLGIREMYGREAERMRAAYIDFLASCPLAVRLDNGVFICHSVPEKVDRQGFDVDVFRRPLSESDVAVGGPVFRLLWGRDYRPENLAAFARLVEAEILVQGHQPCPGGFQAPTPWQIILDCCERQACYLVLPLGGEKLTHRQVLQRIERLT